MSANEKLKRKRSYMCGSEKRKLKKIKEEKAKLLANSLDKFIVSIDKTSNCDNESSNDEGINDPDLTKELNECKNNESTLIDLSEKPVSVSVMNKNIDCDSNTDKENNNSKEIFCKKSYEVTLKTAIEHSKCDNDNDKYEMPLENPSEKSLNDIENSANGNVFQFDSDPAMWTIINDRMIEYFLLNPPPQNMDLVTNTEKQFGEIKRSLVVNNFYHIKVNGEKLLRRWLVLSKSSKSLFCWVCKLLQGNSSSSLNQLITGLNDWKHVSSRLKEHENSISHRQSMMTLSQRSSCSKRIDSSLVQLYQDETKYWIAVLERVVAVVKFLATRGLPFFGDNETIGSRHNGNFLGCIETIAQFDPFLSNHLDKYRNPGKGHVSYLSSTSINEFIYIMARKVEKHIINEILAAKYFSIIVDSTPDITHLDQLCIVIRYINECQPIERFLKFIPIYNHKSETLEAVVLKTLEDFGIDILNCRGQSYDNASNMAGQYSGLQARIKTINPLADFIPCSAHSLNLVGVNAAESSKDATSFFCLVQKIYNFFSSSTHRWQKLNEELKKHDKPITIKNLSGTRWCADAKAVKALRKNYSSVLVCLSELATDNYENACTRSEAAVLMKKLEKFETILNIVVWDTLLQRLNKTSEDLQKSYLNLAKVIKLYKCLIDFTQNVRDNFDIYEELARNICVGEPNYEISRKRKLSRKQSKIPQVSPSSDEVQMTARESYKVNIYFVICDSLIAHLTRRMEPYKCVLEKFSCLIETKSYDIAELREKASHLQKCYPSDLDENFADELMQFSSLIEDGDKIRNTLKKIKNLMLEETFPNVESAFQIFLTLPVSNCSGERSFSLLKRLKSPTRSSLLQEKLTSLALLCIEGDLTGKLDYSDIIHEFACAKSRKKSLY